MEQKETTSLVRYFYEDDDEEKGRRIACAFENLFVHGEMRNYYAPAGPAVHTGDAILCAAPLFFPADPDSNGVEDIIIPMCTCVAEMMRDPNYHFMYAQMLSIDDTDSKGVVETYT